MPAHPLPNITGPRTARCCWIAWARLWYVDYLCTCSTELQQLPVYLPFKYTQDAS